MTALLGATALAAGCASVSTPNPDDPWESYNRSMYTFNDTVDRALLKPIASGYDALTPQPVQTCIHNMFNNVVDVWSALNSFLQARGHDFFNTLGRVLFNSTMGLGGCIDVASMNGSRRIQNDFGVTLGVWGFKSGPYVVLPFLGSSSVRDGTATLGTFAAGVSPITPVFEIDNVPLRNSLIGLYTVDTRASLLDADELVNEVALDRYSFIRDAYIQRRKAQVDSRLADDSLPDYTQDNLPDYSDDEAEAPVAAPAAKPVQ
ncbi:VacJ family lipoprotein [Pollutimonas bauzanensis]|jgi:phospholipid-binding lipoprotein MlaA|uniref:MlaA family lipoprotein n=1 Tax=Pollutimonas bauzanensis TaxID=658167 RepID=UPI0033411C31